MASSTMPRRAAGRAAPARQLPAAAPRLFRAVAGRRGVSLPAGHRSPTAQRRSFRAIVRPSPMPYRSTGGVRNGSRRQPAPSANSSSAAVARRAGAPPAAAAACLPPAGRRPEGGDDGQGDQQRRRRTTAWRRGWRARLSCGSANSARQWPGRGAHQFPAAGAAADRSPPSPPCQQDQWVP